MLYAPPDLIDHSHMPHPLTDDEVAESGRDDIMDWVELGAWFDGRDGVSSDCLSSMSASCVWLVEVRDFTFPPVTGAWSPLELPPSGPDKQNDNIQSTPWPGGTHGTGGGHGTGVEWGLL